MNSIDNHFPLENLATKTIGRNCIYLKSIDSTNDYLKDFSAGLPNGTVVFTDFQQCGKGRLGRRWVEEKGHGLALSVLVTDIALSDLSLLPLICAVAVCNALNALSGKAFFIKWSNDIIFEEKKICGILCESKLLGSDVLAVLGVGINLLQSSEKLKQHDLVYATSLFLATGIKFSINDTSAYLCNALEDILTDYKINGFASIKEQYKKLSITLGRRVKIINSDNPKEATAIDISNSGALICQNDDGSIFEVNSGEASVRGLYGYV